MGELEKMSALIRDVSLTVETAADDFARSLSGLSGIPIMVDDSLQGSNIRIQVSRAMFHRMQEDFQ